MNYGKAEEEISERLNAYFRATGANNFTASPVAETEKEASNWHSQLHLARISIEHIDSSFDSDTGNDIAIISETVRFRLTFEARKRRGQSGVYRLIELTKLALIGYKLSNTDRLTLSKYTRNEIDENAIQLSLDFQCKTLNVQVEVPNENENWGNYKSMNNEEQY